ncbi:CMRF35-like molecule 1 [Notolabrus celidotus]|uniref:CMRF35-like molecule 1 n=1 Tax=Notolabrus celidotus TaxID=1203425 RepID=UPI0014900296|nr:CMRF35-like molecule 1 [Notolabrus celidotus]
MRTSRTLLGFFNASAFCLFWLTNHAVDSAKLSAPEKVTGAYGGSVTISCQYNQRFRNYTKYWCKGPVYELCTILQKTPKRKDNDRGAIVDDQEAGVFTMTMTSLNKSDEGKYWCVIARLGRNTYIGVQLELSDTVITTTSTPFITNEEASWWMALRWILFSIMLFCVVATHIITWRIKAVRKTPPQQQLHHQNSQNIYD